MTAKKTTAAHEPSGPTQTKNRWLWDSVCDVDPAFTKPITGRQYKGTSPNPTWLIRRATEILGPCGVGFGWSVIEDRYVELEPIVMNEHGVVRAKQHECRIEFWWLDPDTKEIGRFESFGATRALYRSANGKFIADEDAAKKSLTDAVIKAMSQLGFAGNIFLGRWDDQKYVDEVRERYGSDDPANAVTPATAPTPKQNGGHPNAPANGADPW